MPEAVLEVSGASKKFCKSVRPSMRYAFSDSIRAFAGLGNGNSSLRDGEFWALKDASFELAAGQALAVIGANGSGKSTLLKLIQGIYEPDEGRIALHGSVTALLKLGISFHPDYTGRENVDLSASSLGISKKILAEKREEIIRFAGLGDFIDSPVKFYSRGMHMRLGFAVASHCDSRLLMIDEALSVGDREFAEKCRDRIARLKKEGRAILLVTHNLATAQALCEKAVWLHKGSVKAEGPADAVCASYERFEPVKKS